MNLYFKCGCVLSIWDGGRGLACCDEHDAPNRLLDEILPLELTYVEYHEEDQTSDNMEQA